MNQISPAWTPRVLVVDDEDPNRLVLDAMLSPEGYEVIQASDGEEALDTLAKGGLDVVLLDVRMPDMDGFEVCRRIRGDLGLRDLPVVFISALSDRMARVQGNEAGADDFLSKPVDNLELLARVRSLVQVKAYHDLLARQRQMIEDELDKTRDLLATSERLAVLGTLAAGVGHELKNVAQMQVIALELLDRILATSSGPTAEALMLLFGVRDHLVMHAKHLLHLGRPGPDQVSTIDLRDVVKSTLQMLKSTSKTKYVTVIEDIGDDPIYVDVNPVRLEQVIMNLVGNAVDALVTGPKRDRRIHVRLPRSDVAGFVRCVIEDNGCGIPARLQKKLFQPYLTTKEPGKGTGLGLAVVKTIIESYSGRLTIKSQEGAGTTVEFLLPASGHMPPPPDRASRSRRPS